MGDLVTLGFHRTLASMKWTMNFFHSFLSQTNLIFHLFTLPDGIIDFLPEKKPWSWGEFEPRSTYLGAKLNRLERKQSCSLSDSLYSPLPLEPISHFPRQQTKIPFFPQWLLFCCYNMSGQCILRKCEITKVRGDPWRPVSRYPLPAPWEYSNGLWKAVRKSLSIWIYQHCVSIQSVRILAQNSN